MLNLEKLQLGLAELYPLLYTEQAIQDQSNYQQILSEQDAQHRMSLYFNIAMLDRKNREEVAASYCFRINNVDILVYQCSQKMSCFLVHATIYNIPVSFIDVELTGKYSGVLAIFGYELDFRLLFDYLLDLYCACNSRALWPQPRQWAVIMSSAVDNLGHYIWNELGGIALYSQLCADRLADKDIRIWKGAYDFLGLYGADSGYQNIRLPTRKIFSATSGFIDVKTCFGSVILRLTALILTPYMRARVSSLIQEISSRSMIDCAKSRLPVKWVENCVIIALRSGRRKWLNQVSAIIQTCLLISDKHPSLTFLIDGLSSYPGQPTWPARTLLMEIILSWLIQKLLYLRNVRCYSLVNLPLCIKITAYQSCFLLIQPIGSANIIPGWFLHSRLLLFGPNRMLRLLLAQESLILNRKPPYVIVPVLSENSSESFQVCPRLLSSQALSCLDSFNLTMRA